jgi:hypothetical protein
LRQHCVRPQPGRKIGRHRNRKLEQHLRIGLALRIVGQRSDAAAAERFVEDEI